MITPMRPDHVSARARLKRWAKRWISMADDPCTAFDATPAEFATAAGLAPDVLARAVRKERSDNARSAVVR